MVPRKKTILIVDDAVENRMLLEDLLLEMNFQSVLCESGEEALRISEGLDLDLALLDITMGGMDGYELCKELLSMKKFEDLPVIFISARNETLDKVKAFKMGGVDYMSKPFEPMELQYRINTHLHIREMQKQLEQYNAHLQDKVAEQLEEISNAQISTIVAMAELAESRDNCTGAHLSRIGAFSRALVERAIEKKMPEALEINNFPYNIFYASALHDIGKVAVPDAILNKPAKLTQEEFEQIKAHCVLGANVLKKVIAKHPGNEFVVIGEQIARYHHEKWNGTGYPYGISGVDIPFAARLVAVADVYDAMRAKRQYKPALSHEEAKAEIIKGNGTHFDPAIVELFLETEDQFKQAEFDADGVEL